MMQLQAKVRSLIREHVEGPCLLPDRLAQLYRDQLIDQVPFEHVLCCETCLDVVNEFLGVARLADRDPLDALRHLSAVTPSHPPSCDEDKNEPDPPLDEGRREPRPDDNVEEEEEQVEDASLSFQRVHAAIAQAHLAQPERLIVCVNGRPIASHPIEPAVQTMILWPDEEIEFVEVISERGTRLAYMDIDPRRLEAAPQRGHVVLSGTREIALEVSHDQAGQATLQVTYQLAEAVIAEAGEDKRLKWLETLAGWKVGVGGWKVPALAMLSIVLLLGGGSLLLSSYIKVRRDLASLEQEQEQMRQQVAQLTKDLEKARQAPVPAPPEGVTPRPPSRSGRQSLAPLKPPTEVADSMTEPGPLPTSADGPEAIRSQQPEAAESLLAVKRIYVMSLGDDPFSQRLRRSLIEALSTSGRFSVTDDPDEADAAVKGSAAQAGSRAHPSKDEEAVGGRVRLRLINGNGGVLWSMDGNGSATDLAARLVKELGDEIKRLEHNRGEVKPKE